MKKKKKIALILLITAVILLVILVAYLALRNIVPDFIDVLRSGDEGQVEDYIRSQGTFTGVLVTAVLQSLQILSIFLSSVPIQVAAGIIFGFWRGFLICFFSTGLTHLGVFMLVRRIGDKLGVLEETDTTVRRWRFLRNSEHPAFSLLLLFLIPLLPNGIIPYLAAKSKISRRDFAILFALGNCPSILIFCAVGSRILSGDYLIAGLLILAQLVIMLTLYLCREKLFVLAEKYQFDIH